MKKNLLAVAGIILFSSLASPHMFAQTFTCVYDMVAINNSAHGCNDGGINTTVPSNVYPSLTHDVYWNGNFVTAVPLGTHAGTTFFSTVFFDSYGLGTWEYFAYYFDSSGNKIDCNYHEVIVTEPECTLKDAGFTSVSGTTCSNGQISGIVSGNFCSQWTNAIYRDSLNGLLIYTASGTTTPTPFLLENLPTGIYFASVTDGACAATYSTVVSSCPKPASGFGVSGITSSQAKVKWNTVTCGISYQVRYRKAGTSTWTKANTTGNTGSKLITGLLPSTSYEWQVRTKCLAEPAVWSVWSKKHSFTTGSLRTGEGNTAMTKNDRLDIVLYPNPAHDLMQVRLENSTPIAVLQILNVNGEILMRENTDLLDDSGIVLLDVSSLPGGAYLLQVITERSFESKLFVKQ